MSKLGDQLYERGAPARGRIASFSPDGSRFVVVLRRGDLSANLNRYTLLLWNTASVRAFAKPRILLEMSSSSIRDGIEADSIVWLGDQETIAFLGENPGEEHQVYAVNARTGQLRRLTSSAKSIHAFGISQLGKRIAYVAETKSHSLWDDETGIHGLVVSTQILQDLIAGEKGYEYRGRSSELDLYVQDQGLSRRIATSHHLGRSSPAAISPDGRYVVITTTIDPEDVVGSWSQYDDVYLKNSLAFLRRSGYGVAAPSAFERYEIVDLASGSETIAVNTPILASSPVVWVSDAVGAERAVLSDIHLPLESVDKTEFQWRTEHTATIEVDPNSGQWLKIGDGCHQAIRWDGQSSELTCVGELSAWDAESARAKDLLKTHQSTKLLSAASGDPKSGPVPIVRYRRSGSRWRAVGTDRSVTAGVELSLKEGMNEAPKIYFERQGDKNPTPLLDLNPQFEDLRFARVEQISWDLTQGGQALGGLYLPNEANSGKRRPLVIQTHSWNPDRFWIDGPWTTSYAAQALAARGIVVLQLQDEYIPEEFGRDGQLREVQRALDIQKSAIGSLVDRGLIDRTRVGIIGFSHTCFYVKYALAHEPLLYAAATVAEGEDGGYLQYMTGQNIYVDVDSIYGGPPFGRNLSGWLQESPAFNLDKVQTPLWITSLNPRFLLLDWEWFEGLRMLRKPVELIMLQGEQHVLQKPSSRLVSQGGNVDWFDFWLNGHEDPDPAKAEQYRRWEKLCELQRANNPGRPTFCVRSPSSN